MGKKHPNFYRTERFLKNYRATKAHINILERHLDDIKEYKSRGIKAVKTDGIRMYQTSGDPVGSEVIKVNEMESIVLEELKNEKRVVQDIDKAITLLNEVEADIIKMKYFDNMQVQMIANYLGYERTSISKKNSSAIKTISGVLFGLNTPKLS